MQVILLERIARLGQMGDEVRVKDGYARNFLLPTHKALRANDANRQKFEGQRAQLEARNLELKQEAETIGEKLDGTTVVLVRQAGETGQLYGSVSARDVAEALTKASFSVARNQVVLHTPIKTIGIHTVPVRLHPEVEVSVSVNVARSEAEAERQVAGEDLSVREEGPAFETFSEDDDDRRGRRNRDDNDGERDDEDEAR
ncbi:50S ribosomal protein L9 [Methylopila sp. 73B]|uniref:50S ribosomal protein L9 n=1 Tax=Methylopila sp. 73B TaxID=1120792 RepID=UPI00035D2E88|nr:50S ribosomal protein L9 [Methylopila sp. 73B]